MFDIMSLFYVDDIGFLNVILLIFAGASVVFASGFKLYSKIRPRFPVRVNCWFCNKNTDVNFSKRSSWDCPFCEQYNGFHQDGSYNKILPAQSDELMNHPVAAVKRKPYTVNKNDLCRKCNINQELKVQQLASFQPIDNHHFDEEIELYRQRLERAYQLCAQCDSKLQQTLKRTQTWLKEKYGIQSSNLGRMLNKVTWWRKALNAVNLMCALLLIPATVILFGSLSGRILTVYPLHISDFARKALLWCSLQEQLTLRCAGALHLLSAFIGQQKYAFHLLPCLLWAISTYVSEEVINSETTYNLQYLAYSQVLVMSSALFISLCSQYGRVSKVFLTTKKSRRSSKKSSKSHSAPILSDEVDNDIKSCEKSVDVPVSNTPLPEENEELKPEPKELQSGIGSLSLGPLGPSRPTSASIFETRTYQPGFTSADLFDRSSSFEDALSTSWGPKSRKPVLSPARLQLNHLTQSSWVAGGYWQHSNYYPTSSSPNSSSFYSNLNSFPTYNSPISRSSSQSSGFVSHVGTNFSSLPNSRAGSVCEADRCSLISEPIYPTYSPPMPYYCYVAAPPPGATLVFPPPPPSQVPASSDCFNNQEEHNRTSTMNFSTTDLRYKPLILVVKENILLATLFIGSLLFNAVIIAFAAMNTFQVH